MNIKVGDLVRVKADWTKTGETWGIIAKIRKDYWNTVMYWAHWSDTKEGVKIATKEEVDNTFESQLTYIRLDSGRYEFDIICTGYNSPLWKVLNGQEV